MQQPSCNATTFLRCNHPYVGRCNETFHATLDRNRCTAVHVICIPWRTSILVLTGVKVEFSLGLVPTLNVRSRDNAEHALEKVY